VKLTEFQPSVREALIACVTNGALRRTRHGYRPPQPGVHAFHHTRAVNALVRAGVATWTDGETEVQPTPEGRELVADAAAASSLLRSNAT
jgi:hypothetical protein